MNEPETDAKVELKSGPAVPQSERLADQFQVPAVPDKAKVAETKNELFPWSVMLPPWSHGEPVACSRLICATRRGIPALCMLT